MDTKLKIETQIFDKTAVLELNGQLDEDSDFSSLLALKQKEYIFDFNNVSMINSCGVREWISFIEKLPRDVEIIYRKCPKIVIEQINMVHGFIRQGASIESFYAPFYCEHCDKEEAIFIESKDLSDTEDGPVPKSKCPHCGKQMEFDAMEEQYFHFLRGEK